MTGTGKYIDNANNISQQQVNAANTAGATATAEQKQFQDLLAPFVKQQTALATGDRQASLSAAMPIISKLSEGFMGAKSQIMNNMAPGAARDTALATLEAQKATGIGGAQADMVRAAPGNLLQPANMVGSNALQQLGASFAGYGSGAQTNQSAGQMQQAQNQALLNFFTGLAGTASNLVPGVAPAKAGKSALSGFLGW